MKTVSTVVAAALLAATSTLAEPIWVGRFSEGTQDWRDVSVSDKLAPTRYAERLWDGVAAIEARAERSMSLYARPLAVDIEATPVLCWRWRVAAPLRTADMASKAGDDYAARVYVSFALPPERLDFGTRAKLALGRAIWGAQLPDAALNYVWDNRHPVGTMRPNAYTDRTRMVVAQSGAAEAGAWVTERHDVASDLAAAFGSADGARPVQLAIASDTDNTGESAHAGFADFHFVAREEPCAFGPAAAPHPGPLPSGERDSPASRRTRQNRQAMNKAFTKESDGDDAEPGDEDAALPPLPAGAKNYITPAGYARLHAELLALIDDERPKVVDTVSWAAKNGDRSENGDYIYGKKRLREIDRRIRFLTKRLEIAELADPSAHHGKDQVFFGASVTYATPDGAERTVTIKGIDEADALHGEVSWISPIARALLKAREGDEVQLLTPAGPQKIEVLEVRYPAPAGRRA